MLRYVNTNYPPSAFDALSRLAMEGMRNRCRPSSFCRWLICTTRSKVIQLDAGCRVGRDIEACITRQDLDHFSRAWAVVWVIGDHGFYELPQSKRILLLSSRD